MAQLICLASSWRPGGRCIAGIDPQTGAWVRPVPFHGGAIPEERIWLNNQPEYEDHARLGAMACPEQAISIIDDDPEAARRFRIVPAGEVAVRLVASDGTATGRPDEVLDPA